jgi:uncharacterized membrane protein YfcA
LGAKGARGTETHILLFLAAIAAGAINTLAAVEGSIDWGYGVPMALGGLLGGYLGGMVSGRVNRTVLRTVVIAIGLGVAAYYLWTLYGPSKFQIGGE